MNLKKESKIRILENFYGLDYTLFGKHVNKMDLCCPVFIEEYLSIKGSLLSLVIEMYRLIKHSPKMINEITTLEIIRNSQQSAIIARENSKKLVTSEKGREEIKRSLQETLSHSSNNDIEKIVENKITKKAFSLAVDNLLVGRAITESKKVDKLNSWEGRIIEDAYKVVRDDLIESAVNIIELNENNKEDQLINESKAELIKAALATKKNVFKKLIELKNKIKNTQSLVKTNKLSPEKGKQILSGLKAEASKRINKIKSINQYVSSMV